MTAENILRVTCDYCDTTLLIPVREAVDFTEVLEQVRKHRWTENADAEVMRHLCPCCVGLFYDSSPPSEDIPW